MTTVVKLRCRCGSVRGTVEEVSPSTVNHAICYCDDCQTFANFLGSEGITDAWGGTDIVQVGPARMKITEGAEHLRCVRLSPKGLHRFYAGCCKTPIGNAMPPVPFVGIPRAFLEVDAEKSDETFGPADTVQGRFARGIPPAHVHPKASFRTLARSAQRVLSWLIFARRPSPYFDPKTGKPCVAPQILTKDERATHRDGPRPKP